MWGGTADRIINGETGYLVEPGNIDQLAQVLLSLLDDPEKCRALGMAGRKLVQARFTWPKVGELMNEYMEATLQQEREKLVRVPRVSIGMPVYNGEMYLEETLDSLLAQTFTDFELIICDNASTDRTATICEAYAARDGRIHYHRTEKNLGAAPNYNRAFHLSGGEFFKWMAHDDPISPTFLERCVQWLDAKPDAIMCYPKTVLIDAESKKSDYMPDYEDKFDLHDPDLQCRLRKNFYIGDQCHPVFGLIRRNILRKTILIGSFASSDHLLLGELAIRGKCYEIPEYLAFRRLHLGNSVIHMHSHKALIAWFDPQASSFGGRRVRLIWEYLRAVQRGAETSREKRLCYWELGRFMCLSIWCKIKRPMPAPVRVQLEGS